MEVGKIAQFENYRVAVAAQLVWGDDPELYWPPLIQELANQPMDVAGRCIAFTLTTSHYSEVEYYLKFVSTMCSKWAYTLKYFDTTDTSTEYRRSYSFLFILEDLI